MQARVCTDVHTNFDIGHSLLKFFSLARWKHSYLFLDSLFNILWLSNFLQCKILQIKKVEMVIIICNFDERWMYDFISRCWWWFAGCIELDWIDTDPMLTSYFKLVCQPMSMPCLMLTVSTCLGSLNFIQNFYCIRMPGLVICKLPKH